MIACWKDDENSRLQREGGRRLAGPGRDEPDSRTAPSIF
jgi:hypothetical protein